MFDQVSTRSLVLITEKKIKEQIECYLVIEKIVKTWPSIKSRLTMGPLCWFQTSLPFTALPLRRVITAWSPLDVSWLQLLAATRFGFSSSGIAPKLNRSQLYAICRCGQSGKVIDLLARRCLPFGQASAASGACAVVQISLSKRQSGERQASLKAA